MAKDTFAVLVSVTIENLVACSLSNHLAKLLSHLSNEAATENHVQHTSICMACLAGTDLLPGLVVQPIAIAVDMKRILSGECWTISRLGEALPSSLVNSFVWTRPCHLF